MPMKLYLASKSPRRQELLQLITTDFTVIDSTFDEDAVPVLQPEEYVKALALGKASHTAKKLSDTDIIIGCDTVVVSPQGDIFGKPQDRADAYRMINELAGNTHTVITGVSLLGKEKDFTFAVKSFVTFYPLTEDEINEYLDTLEYTDKAGAYGIQGKGSLLCEKIDGDYFNIVGLPVSALARALKRFF